MNKGAEDLVGSGADGTVGVQDEGSQLTAWGLTRVTSTTADDWWLDLCAGPGGKSALLAGLAAERSAHLVAAEIAPHRARLVAKALRAYAASAPVRTGLVADGTRPAWRSAAFDRVLVDAPCTGLGALRRRPEARWRRSAGEVRELHQLQVALLQAALDSTRAGGVVAYATCSPHLTETRQVVHTILSTRDDTEPVDARPQLPGVPDLGDGPDVQLWPHRHGTDAMFLAVLAREDHP